MAAIPAQRQAASGTDTTFASSVQATFSSPNFKGNTILLAWEGDASLTTNTANTPTDTAGNTYYRVTSQNISGTFNLEVWVAYNIKASASNTVTVTDTIGGANGIVIVEEWSGISGINSPDNFAGTTDNTGVSTALSSGAFSTKTSACLIWVAGYTTITGVSLSAGSGYSNLTTASTPGFSVLGICSKVVTDSSSYTGTMTSAVASSWGCAAVGMRASNEKLGTMVGGNNLRAHAFSPGRAR